MNSIPPTAGNWANGRMELNRVRILHLEDSAADAALILDLLDDKELPCAITHALGREDFETAIEREAFDIILCDNHLPGYSGFAALEFAKQRQPEVPVIILSGTLDDEHAVQSLKLGATDYVLKERLVRLIPAIRRALNEADQRVIKEAASDRMREQADLLNLTSDAILVRNLNDRVVYWNAGAHALFGWSEEQAIGQDFAGLLQGDLTLLGQARQQLLQTGEWLGEIKLKTKNGCEITVMSRWNLLRDKDGQPRRILTTNTDISEMKGLQAALLRSQRMESIGALAGGIVHDLTNSLSPALLSAELLETCEDSAQRHKHIAVIRSAVQRAGALAHRITSFTNGHDNANGLLALDVQVRELEKLLRDTLPKSISVVVNIGAVKCVIEGNPVSLRQALLNLCVNARDSMTDGGRLTLSIHNVVLTVKQAAALRGRPGSFVVLSVSDNGSGIPRDTLPRIFEPSFTTKSSEGRMGLGLSFVAEIMKTHGGFIDVQTEPGKGADFKLYFPTVNDAKKVEAPPQRPPLPGGHDELVLLIEDEEAVRELTKSCLENFGYRILTAQNGAQGFARFQENRDKIRAVVTDTDMPEMNGLAAARAMRKLNSDLPVIVASGTLLDPDELRWIESERMTNLNKPYTLEQLLVGLHAAIHPKLPAGH